MAAVIVAIVAGTLIRHSYLNRYSISTDYTYSGESDENTEKKTDEIIDNNADSLSDIDEANISDTEANVLDELDENAVFLSGAGGQSTSVASSGTYVPTIACHYSWWGSVTEIIANPEYYDYRKGGLDLDGDGLTDSFTRGKWVTDDNVQYVDFKFEFGNGTSFTTDSHFTQFPNEGTVVEFNDLDEDNIDEILIAHYTDSTIGPVAWNCVIYTYVDDGQWARHQVVDDDGIMVLGDYEVGHSINDYMDENGYSYQVRGVEFSGSDGSKLAFLMYLVDYNTYSYAPDLDAFLFRYEGGKWILESQSSVAGWDPMEWAWPYGI